ncbi:uncharacterized protein N0V89_010639 [Didymosphaeria variabile]|uniref:Heterokaryon incompatibility domain-containing protein n=1 Tax=Didymosphaeria variabile TaxID=1932322 RepID=A0A9W8XCJ1_9PLEO|nr:uncharacterized protein N0V89_010639 [Didymosphaeria variabile]KAJ4346707.1 hypothetical protein N0V89_010639 [Didymosphaeria variabile]
MTPGSAAPIKRRSFWDIGFTPLTEKERALSRMDEEQPNILCQYCQMLLHEIDRALFGSNCVLDDTILAGDDDVEEEEVFMSGALNPDPSKWTQAEAKIVEEDFPNTKRKVRYQEIHDSAVQGCLCCTIIDIRCDDGRNADRTSRMVETGVAATYADGKMTNIRIEITVSVKGNPGQGTLLSEVSINTFSSRRYAGSRMRPTGSIYTASQNCFDIGQSWLHRCLNGHQECPRFEPKWMPTRVIAISGADQASLVETNTLPTLVAYYALSYCWGTEPVLTTTKSRYEEFKRSIPIKDLPYTIKDAIRAVYDMGGRYLWVDSMCIVQDDSEDWKREAATMCDVYQHALLTIVALGASGANEGLFSRREPRSVQNCDVESELKPTEYISLTNRQSKDIGARRFIESKFHSRGWTFQERALAPRKIYFSSLLFWECKTCTLEEGDTRMHINITKPIGSQDIRNNQEETVPDEDGYMSTPRTLRLWHDNLRIFTQRDLTVATDRLPAISGVITEFSRNTGWKSINGIWSDHLAVDLLWILYDEFREVPRLVGAPTWSWTSIAAPIRHYYDMKYSLVEDSNVYIDSEDSSILNARGGLLDLHPELPSSDVSEDLDVTSMRWVVQDLPTITDHMMHVDRPEHIPEGPHYFLPLIMADLQADLSWEDTGTVCMGLALVQVSEREDYFERFGVLLVWFDIGVIPSQKITFRRGKVEWPHKKWRNVRIV